MPERTADFVHPAVRAWRGLCPGAGEPEAVEALKETKKSRVYRLAGLGPGASAVIAKRCRWGTALVERAVYEDVLPRLPLPRLGYFGAVPEADRSACWLFLEDAGREECDRSLAEHRRLAARWLGALHVAAACVPAAARLPGREPVDYLACLCAVRGAVADSLSNPALGADGRATLGRVVAHCSALEARWDRVNDSCRRMPRTLVHGDFVVKNLRVRPGPAGPEFFPLDWETAGWGVPAADLAQFAGSLGANPDLRDYSAAVREAWPGLGSKDVPRLASLGVLFRLISAVGWAAEGLRYDWVQRSMLKIQSYEPQLAGLLQAPGWEG